MIHIFDGAMGTMLHQAGLPTETCPEEWNLSQPDSVTAIHRQYVDSGADIIETNTFGANRIKLTNYGLQNKVAEINEAAVRAARSACGPKTKVAGSVGPTGQLISPLGELLFDDAYEAFFEQIKALSTGGADLIIIETIIDIQEMRAALLAARDATHLPIICQLSFGSDGRTITGTDPQTAAVILDAMGADIIGANCSLGPAQLLGIVTELAKATNKPISVQPNAGMPRLENGETVFPMDPNEMALWAPKLIAAGASYIGGCCGTTPDHIKAIKHALAGVSSIERSNIKTTVITSRTKSVHLGPGMPAIVIGERINPTGRKALAAEIHEGSFAMVKKEALEQVRAGAAVLDINMGVPGINQSQVMKKAVEELSLLVDVPFAIDTTDPEALEAGLRAFPGRALINSVSAEPERIEAFLPLAKKYGAAVLCLPIGPEGVPATAVERKEVAQRIIDAAYRAGLRQQDLLLDPLVLTVAAEAHAASETLETLKLYRKYFGFPTAMGLSNISYGLPRRDIMNATFLSMALTAGLDAPILNPYDPLIQDVLNSTKALLSHDQNGHRYSEIYAAQISVTAGNDTRVPETDIITRIKQAVISGEKEAIPDLIQQALRTGSSPLDITDQALTAAMNEIGVAFGAGRCFLPQVLLAAETMRSAFQTLKQELPTLSNQSAGTIILATVKGDIHDLGKNIVAALMENNGFKVLDLGKDVSLEKIVETAQKEKPELLGLCALMTTTLPQVDSTISALKAAGSSAKIIVGGAVVTEEYAKSAGADAYAANGVDAVNIAKQLIQHAK